MTPVPRCFPCAVANLLQTCKLRFGFVTIGRRCYVVCFQSDFSFHVAYAPSHALAVILCVLRSLYLLVIKADASPVHLRRTQQIQHQNEACTYAYQQKQRRVIRKRVNNKQRNGEGLSDEHSGAKTVTDGNQDGEGDQKVCALRHTPQPSANSSPVGGCLIFSGQWSASSGWPATTTCHDTTRCVRGRVSGLTSTVREATTVSRGYCRARKAQLMQPAKGRQCQHRNTQRTLWASGTLGQFTLRLHFLHVAWLLVTRLAEVRRTEAEPHLRVVNSYQTQTNAGSQAPFLPAQLTKDAAKPQVQRELNSGLASTHTHRHGAAEPALELNEVRAVLRTHRVSGVRDAASAQQLRRVKLAASNTTGPLTAKVRLLWARTIPRTSQLARNGQDGLLSTVGTIVPCT